MNKKMLRHIGGCLLLLLILGLGALMPGAMLAGTDRALSKQHWAIADTENGYRYVGTFENRVRALDAWQNGSPNVQYTKTDEETDLSRKSVWDDLFRNGLLPINIKDAACTMQAFRLEPSGSFATYEYLDIVCTAESARLHVLLDAATEKYLRIDFTCDPAILSDWMQDSGEGFNTVYKRDILMKAYAQLLGSAALQDINGNYIDGEAIQGFEADLQGSLCAISFKYAARQGLVTYKIFAHPFV